MGVLRQSLQLKPLNVSRETMTLTELRYLISLANERHFGRAAERCHVSQPTLSIAIKKLEGELGIALFERNNAELRITPIGEQVVAQAKKVLEEAVLVEEIAQTGRDPLRGILRIGAIYTVAPYLLPKLVQSLHKRASEMPLYIREDFTENLIPALKSGDLDVLLLALPLNVPGIVVQGIYEEPFRVVVPVDSPWQGAVSPTDLDGRSTLMLGRGNCFRDQVLESCPSLSEGSGEPSRLAEGGSLETLRYMVASGAGVAVMPSSAADPLVAAEPLIRVLPFEEPAPRRVIAMAWRVSFPRTGAIEVFKKAVRDCQLAGVRSLSSQ